MNESRWRAARELFDEAMSIASGERVGFVERRAGENRELLAEVKSLLTAHDAAGSFLAGTDVGVLPHLDDPGSPEVVRERIGPWRIVSVLGRGGMGVVYLGERESGDFEQRVAIKVVSGGAESAEIVRRFRNERRLLANLEHPGIARLLDGGTTEDGLPFFVMEHVEGEGLLEFADRHRLGLRARIELFLEVCAAVEHAHQRLIVHRDLKPGNILVGSDGRPKLLDFGIGKIVGATQGEEQLQLTATLGRFMTLAYASPEQIRGLATTTATDVYGLGMVLFEMLTGSRPYRVLGTGSRQIEDAILEQEPRRPSSVVDEADLADPTQRPAPDSDGALRARCRATTPERLRRSLRGDLDNVLRKALAKQPSDRYAAVAGLSADLRRYLAGHTVVARDAGLFHRAGKFVSRNRWAVAATIAVVASIVALSAIYGIRLRAERNLAERRFADVRELANHFLFEIHDRISILPGATSAREELLATGVKYLDRLAADGRREPELTTELAAGYLRLGTLQGGSVGTTSTSGKLELAIASFGKGLELLGELPEEAADAVSARRVRWGLEAGLGDALVQRGEVASALPRFRLATRLSRESADAFPGDHDLRDEAALMALRLAMGLTLAGEMRDSETLLLETQSFVAAGSSDWRESLAANRRSAEIANQLASMFAAAERWGEAIQASERCVSASGRTVERLPDDTDVRFEHAVVVGQTGWLHARGGDAANGLVLLERAAGQLEELIRADSADQRLVDNLAVTWEGRGEALARLGRTAEAQAAFLRAARMYDELVAHDPANLYLAGSAGYERLRAGELMLASKADFSAAERLFLAALPQLEATPSPVLDHRAGAARAYFGLGEVALWRATTAGWPSRDRHLDSAASSYAKASERWRVLASEVALPPSLALHAESADRRLGERTAARGSTATSGSRDVR